MKKSLLNLGTVLNKSEQKLIFGGTDNDVFQHEGRDCYIIIAPGSTSQTVVCNGD